MGKIHKDDVLKESSFMDIQRADDFSACIFRFFRTLSPIMQNVFFQSLHRFGGEHSGREGGLSSSLLMDTKIHFNIFTSMNIFFSFSGK